MKKIMLAVLLCLLSFPAFAGEKESAYDRVMQTETIRCGYNVWPPYIIKDPNTGAMSGLSYDYMNALGKELGLKIEWAAETGWGDFQEGLNGGKYDVMCVTVWQSGQRARVALLTRPVYKNSLFACARADDARFDKDMDAVNSPDVTVAYTENDVAQAIKETRFPEAKGLALPQYSDPSQVILSVTTKKADVSLCDLDNLARYNENAPAGQKLKAIAGSKSVREFATVLAVRKGEYSLKHMLDSAIQALDMSGEAKKIVAPYEPTFSMIDK